MTYTFQDFGNTSLLVVRVLVCVLPVEDLVAPAGPAAAEVAREDLSVCVQAMLAEKSCTQYLLYQAAWPLSTCRASPAGRASTLSGASVGKIYRQTSISHQKEGLYDRIALRSLPARKQEATSSFASVRINCGGKSGSR